MKPSSRQKSRKRADRLPCPSILEFRLIRTVSNCQGDTLSPGAR